MTLTDACESCSRAEDRSQYRDHLAAAAALYRLLRLNDAASARNRVASEREYYGLSFISGEAGTETAFTRLAGILTDL